MSRVAGIGVGVLGIVTLLAASALTFGVFPPDSWLYHRRIALGNRDSQKVDAFRQRTGRLPSSLEDVGVTVDESGPIYYDRCSDSQYILWFGTTLGQSMSFDSANRSWVSLNITCPARK
ncbi:MAG TPA: hypothetical protein VKB38_24580 [Terracidiphilus sp.]|nr:hypothetical protein [Terracidiphilus sp.]